MPVIVSAYFKIPSKQPHSFYMRHMYRFFDYLQGKDIVFFCTRDTHSEILLFNLDLTHVLFVYCNWADLAILTKYPTSFWEKHKKIDPETYHTPELGIVWASKKEFLSQAMNMYPLEDWFLWVDAGSIRLDTWKESCKHLFRNTIREPGVYLQNLNPIPMNQPFFRAFTGTAWIAGGLIYAHRQYISSFSSAYDAMLLTYDAAGVPAIMDQYIMASLITKGEAKYLHTVNHYELTEMSYPDPWFFFLSYI